MGGGEGGNLRGFRATKGARGSVKIHMSRHEKHIAGTKNYNQQRQNGKSYGSVKRWSIMVELLESIIMKRRTSTTIQHGPRSIKTTRETRILCRQDPIGSKIRYSIEEQKYKELLYVIDDWFNKDPIIIQWSNGLKVQCKSFTGICETDMEPDEEDYIGEYTIGVNEVEILESGSDDSVEINEGSIEICLLNKSQQKTVPSCGRDRLISKRTGPPVQAYRLYWDTVSVRMVYPNSHIHPHRTNMAVCHVLFFCDDVCPITGYDFIKTSHASVIKPCMTVLLI